MPRMTVGLPEDATMDSQFAGLVAGRCESANTVNRTMIVQLSSSLHFFVIVSAMTNSGLLSHVRWLNFSATE